MSWRTVFLHEYTHPLKHITGLSRVYLLFGRLRWSAKLSRWNGISQAAAWSMPSDIHGGGGGNDLPGKPAWCVTLVLQSWQFVCTQPERETVPLTAQRNQITCMNVETRPLIFHFVINNYGVEDHKPASCTLFKSCALPVCVFADLQLNMQTGSSENTLMEGIMNILAMIAHSHTAEIKWCTNDAAGTRKARQNSADSQAVAKRIWGAEIKQEREADNSS